MTYTDLAAEAERLAFLNSETRGDVLAWLTSPGYGVIEKEWDDEE